MNDDLRKKRSVMLRNGLIYQVLGLIGAYLAVFVARDSDVAMAGVVSIVLTIVAWEYIDIYFLGRDLFGFFHEEWEGTPPWEF